MKFDPKNTRIAIIGLGYVGLPLAVEFAKKYPVIGFDIKQSRIDELNSGHDSTLEVENKDLKAVLLKDNPIKQTQSDHAQNTIHKTQPETWNLKHETNSSSLVTRNLSPVEKGLFLTTNTQGIANCNYYIITVPTSIDKNKCPDLSHLIKASEIVGNVLKKNDIVIYESTVYPGATEEDCVPVLEKYSKLLFNNDFFCGYSPERINPGDKINTLTKIVKVTSGSNDKIANIVDDLYKSIITAGTHKVSNIKVAEASKAIENAQRDLNISFVNELALIFDRIGINTNEVIEAASTKWNFLKFKPGLVGGHCIGVDPYYLLWKAEELGYYPEVIKSGRRINEYMGRFVSNKIIKLMIQKGQRISCSKILILGITFKENCPDIRNTGIVDVITELKEFGCEVHVIDPWANKNEVKREYNIDLKSSTDNIDNNNYGAIILAVAHDKFKEFDIQNFRTNNSVIFDIKGVWDRSIVDGSL